MAKSSPKSKSKKTSPPPKQNPVLTGLLLSALGIVTGLGLFSSQSSTILSTIQSLLLKGFGWGSYPLPLLLLGGGLLILLRKMEGIPKFSPVQIAGVVILYLAGLISLQYFTFPVDFNASRTIAAGGLGGGYAGAYLLAPLQATFGSAGTAIAIFAVILLSLSLTLDIPILDLFKWIPGFMGSLKTLFQKLFPKQEKPAQAPTAAAKIPTPILRRVPEAQPGPATEPAMFPDDAPDLNWVLPHIPDILNIGQDIEPNEEFDQHRAAIIEETLESFGAPGHVVDGASGSAKLPGWPMTWRWLWQPDASAWKHRFPVRDISA